MSQMENLLNSVSEEISTVDHVVIGKDRFMVIPDHIKKIGVSPDHGVNTVKFVGPRYSENGTDLSTMSIWVNYMRADGYMDAGRCENIKVDAEDDTLLHYEWKITRNITEVHGNLTALVCAKSVDAEGNEENHWNSELNHDFYISEGMEVQETVLAQYPDIVEHLLLRMATVENKTTQAAMLNYVKQYLDKDPSVVIEKIEEVIAGYPIQEFVNGYLDEHVDVILDAENIKYTEDQTVGEAITAQQTALDQQYEQLTGYTDQKIAELINGAPSTLDTLKEVADAMAENESVVEALNEAIGSRAKEADVRELAHKATAASTTNLDELTGAGIWYEYNKVCTGVPTELENTTIIALIKNETVVNLTIQTLTTISNGVISSWKRRYSSTGAWGAWYKCINSNDMAKLRTMHIGIEALGVSTNSTITLLELFDLMDTVSEATFFVTSSRYTEIYKEILAGIQSAYPNITSISAHVTIRKNGTTSYVTVEDYVEPSNKFETIYKGDVADNWVKYITTSDTESRRMYINPSNFGCSNSDETLDLVSMINKMDAKSHVNFWINNSGQFTKIYNEILTGIKTKYPEVTNIFGNVDILKTDGTAYVKASQYDNPNNVFIATYSTVNSVGMSEWVKVASGTDLSEIRTDLNSHLNTSRTMYRYPWDFGCNVDDTTLTLEKMYNSMSDRSEVTFWINNSGSYTSIYNQVLEGLIEAGYTVRAVHGLVTIRKTAKTATVRWEFYYETTEVYERRYTTENSPRWGKWEKIATGTDLEEIGTYTSTSYAEVGYKDEIVVGATICMQKLSKTRCNLYISYKIWTNNETDSNIFYFMSGEKIRNALGLKTLAAVASQSQVTFTPSFDVDSNGNLTVVSAETALGVMGHTGIKATIDATGLQMGRIYDSTGAYGSWPVGPYSDSLFKVNTYGQINFYGARYSI